MPTNWLPFHLEDLTNISANLTRKVGNETKDSFLKLINSKEEKNPVIILQSDVYLR